MSLDPSALPGLHEAQERLETQNLLDAGLGPRLGVSAESWPGGLWTVRCTSAPQHGPGNQITGLRPAHLDALGPVLAWFDEAGTDTFLRWPGPALGDAEGRALAELGFHVHELEAWMSAPLDGLEVEAVPHDIREVAGPEDVEAYGQAFVGGWSISDPSKREIALAAMAPWPGPAVWRRYVAFVDGVPAGEAVLTTFGEVAYLAEAATVPAFRRRGIQRALIARRVADARRAGATTLFGAVQYGDQSWANMRALGLRESYLTVRFRRLAPGPGRIGP